MPTPHAGAGEIRMRVRAVAVSPSDVLIRHGRTPTTPGHMVIPGTDAADVVDEIGPGAVTDLAVGDAALTYVHPLGPDGGAYAEHVVLPADWVPARRDERRRPRCRSTASKVRMTHLVSNENHLRGN